VSNPSRDVLKSPAISTWRSDLLASFVVFLVALPLCMGISIASGVPVGAGLITGIVGGLVVGFLAGSPLQVSGPAASLTVFVIAIVNDEELGLPMLGLIVLGAGALQILAGLLKLGQWFRAISPTVIAAMLAGIGIIILSSQFHVMVDDVPGKSVVQNILSIPSAIMKGVVPAADSYHHHAAWIGIVTIAVVVGWDSLKPEKLSVIPGPLLGVIIAVAVAHFMHMEQILYVELPDSLVESIHWPDFGDGSFLLNQKYWSKAAAVAVVASAASLLCATAIDQLHSGEGTDYDRELIAQGVGNSICGLLGALPMTGVIVRSSANLNAGGKTRWSAILHGAWLLGLVVIAPFILTMIPKSSLAAVLVYIGFRLVDLSTIRKLRAFGRDEIAIYGVTLLLILTTDLLVGVLVGCVLSVLKLHYKFSHLELRVDPPDELNDEHVYLVGAATFLRLPYLAQAFDRLRDGERYTLNFDELEYIDHACLELIASWEKQVLHRGGQVSIEWGNLLHRYNYREKDPDPSISRSML